MKFKSGTRRKAIEYEKDLVKYWKENKTFEKSVEMRPADKAFVFYDGPPFISGVPHHGTLLSSIIKDVVPRYQTMKGKRVERRWGWDCHGLPAENFVEKKLGITDRHDIGTKISLEDYITACRENMVATAGLWEDTIDRIGRWVDFKGAYKTMDKDYMESVWWAFKQLYEKGKIYEGERVLMYDTKWATPLSKAEVTMDAGAYQVVTDPSVHVKFKLKDWAAGDDKSQESRVKSQEKAIGADTQNPDLGPQTSELMTHNSVFLLAWTTTPWTLPANTALAVNGEVDYTEIELDGVRYIVAKDLAKNVFTDEKHKLLEYNIIRDSFKGSELVGETYEPLFVDRGKNAHKIWDAPYVTTESGTGIVHLAPAYGEEDFILAQKVGIPVIHVLDEYGTYTEGDWTGENVWEINKTIAKTLKERGVVWKIDYIQHEYPHNLRNGNKLMYRAHPSWFMDIDGQRTLMLEQNTENITWFPEHIKHGRFEKTMLTAPDWNLSRDRFWATAMPVWKGTDKDGKEQVIVVGSYAELKELSGVELEDYHRPWVDEITFTKDDVEYKRIDKVMDCWFESGSMPFAQFHYPFENKEKFEANFPGDFIVEYVGQVRAWFYYVHAVNVGLFGHNGFKNVITTGTLAGNDGRKMSKSLGNYTDPNELMDQFSADSLRFLLASSPLLSGEDFTLQDKDVSDVNRKLAMVWNMYDFFTLYASVDGWEFKGDLADPSSDCQNPLNSRHSELVSGSNINADEILKQVQDDGSVSNQSYGTVTNPLDVWIISRLHQLITEVDEYMQKYDLPNATKPILEFIEDASNWYVRRSRKRFWKSEDDSDKNNAYCTLHYLLTQLSKVMASFTPFLAEELYRNLTGEESVHLVDWPQPGHINELLLSQMAGLKEVITIGLGMRAENKLKVRQPLQSITLDVGLENKFSDELAEILKEELNIKEVIYKTSGSDPKKTIGEIIEENGMPNYYRVKAIDTHITPELKSEGLMREVVRTVQAARKAAGLQVDDRIRLSLYAPAAPELAAAINEYNDVIMAETLAVDLQSTQEPYAFRQDAKVEGDMLTVALERAT